MSTTSITALVERMLRPLQEALACSDEQIEGLQALNAHITTTEALEIPTAAKRQLIETLRRQRRSVEQTWLASVGAEFKAQARGLGLLVESVRVAKRVPRKAKPKAQDGQTPPAGGSPPSEGPKNGGFLRRTN